MRLPLALAGLAALVYAGAFHVGPAQDLDAAVLDFLTGFDDTPVEFFSETIVDLIKPVVYGPICLAIVVLAWRRAGFGTAAAAAVAVLGANATSQLLKRALAEPRPHEETARQVDAASWPSGHVTAAAIAVLAVLLFVPDRLRRRVAVGGALLVAGMGVAVVANNWHYPSDALGGAAVAGAWGTAAAAWLSSRRPAATAAPRRRWLRATG